MAFKFRLNSEVIPLTLTGEMKANLRIYGLAVAALLAVVDISASPPRSRGARPIALGNGYTAAAGDPYSLFYNPAGLAELAQKEVVFDYGRSHSIDESARSDFNGIYATPYRYKDHYVPIAVGLYGDAPAPGAHIIDLTVGGGMDAPADKWSKGFVKWPVRLGAAVNLRQQQGDEFSKRVGKSSLGLGVTGGAFIPVNSRLQLGMSIRDLYLGSADPVGPMISFGAQKRVRDNLNLMADLQIRNGGIWAFNPGAEWLLARGVLRPRVGWGFRDTGNVDLLATGIGIYFSPYQIDFAYLLPLRRPTDPSDQLRVSFSYRFGTPHFSEVYYDRALEAASKLDQNVLQMTVREAELKASLSELEQKRRLAQEELQNSKQRIEALRDKDLLGQRDAKIRTLEARIRELEGQVSRVRSETQQLRQKQATIRMHTVKAGDTLQTLAREYYGDPNQWKKIYNANTDKIDRGLPRIGARLIIP